MFGVAVKKDQDHKFSCYNGPEAYHYSLYLGKSFSLVTRNGVKMFWNLASLFLQLGLKLLPVLKQLKILKSEEELKELQRRFEEAIRRCEEGTLDPVLVRKQHEENEKQLEEEWKKKWGDKPK